MSASDFRARLASTQIMTVGSAVELWFDLLKLLTQGRAVYSLFCLEESKIFAISPFLGYLLRRLL